MKTFFTPLLFKGLASVLVMLALQVPLSAQQNIDSLSNCMSTYIGGSGSEGSDMSMFVGAGEITYLAGKTESSNYPVTPNAAQSTLLGVSGAVLSKIDSA